MIRSLSKVFQYRMLSTNNNKSKTFTEIRLERFYKKNPELDPNRKPKKTKKGSKK